MVLQISHRVCSEIPEEGHLWDAAQRDRKDSPGVMQAAESGVGGRTCDGGSRAPVFEHSAKVQRGEHGGSAEREIGNPNSPAIRASGIYIFDEFPDDEEMILLE